MSKKAAHCSKLSWVLDMHCRNCLFSKSQTRPEGGTTARALSTGGASPPRPPPKSELPIIEPAIDPAADEAKVPIILGPDDC
eukprot:scaffold4348_cov135-Isochrysis_galbana.AAC.3